MSQKLSGRVPAFNANGPGFNPRPSILLFANRQLLQLQHLTSAGYKALINCCEAGAAYDFFFLWSINVYAALV